MHISHSSILMPLGNSDGQLQGPGLSVLDGEHSPARTLHTTGWVNSDVHGMTYTVAEPFRMPFKVVRKKRLPLVLALHGRQIFRSGGVR